MVVGENNTLMKHWGLFCDSEKDDRIEKDDEASSAEDWSANEKDYDSDGIENMERDVVYPSYDPTINWRLTKPILGMKFESPKQLKESLIDYGVSNSYQLEFTVNDYRRLLVVCGEEKTEDEEDHEGKKKKIAKRYFKQIVENPEISLRQMQTDIMRKFECKVSIGQCSRAKKKILDDYEGGLKEHYARLSDYKAEILETNPGSTVKMAVNEMENGEVYFSSYYICFKGVKDGWINGCRKVLGLDGCFLKNSGQLLTAMGRDANNHIFPLAWAAVSVENKENWKWFLNLMRYDIEMESGLGLTLISDQHKGIIEAVKDVFPYAEHRQCVRFWKVVPGDNTVFEVRSEKYACVVNLDEKTCSCRLCQLSGIPCVHIVATLSFVNKDPETFVSSWLKKDMFRVAYKYPIKPLRGSTFWPKTDDIKPLPPNERRMPGRPAVKRKRSTDEKEKKNPKVGIGRKMSCQNCYEMGHNVRSCKNEKKDPPPKVKRPKGRPKKRGATKKV
ncbi:uncharacterized protein LOC110893298 [Helianthus annuus]|uniref:uncharacterized protein LOC110893298 n=1 Tax=Helianthus annuus TaxID=4232 RepID=UPI000B901643|nr:uncharacterized protein LOC110893298 [Helianthus annuus]